MSSQSTAVARTIETRVGPLRVQTDGSGPPALLWHSLFVDSTTWNRLRPRLVGERRLVLVDGPNHGANARRRVPFTLNDCLGAAIDILDDLGITEPVDWLGNAWGGHVGLLFAADHPQRCRSLMAIGAPVHGLSPGDRRQIRLLAALYLVGGAAAVSRLLVDALVGRDSRTSDPEARSIVRQAFERAGRLGMFDAVRWLSLQRQDLTPTLHRIERPTLVTTGPDDPMWTIASARDAAGRLPFGALVILPGSGHIGPLLQSAPVLGDLIIDFWRDPTATVSSRSAATPSPA
jgi:pimeloyl-ACP methyl ester carboxylesterase